MCGHSFMTTMGATKTTQLPQSDQHPHKGYSAHGQSPLQIVLPRGKQAGIFFNAAKSLWPSASFQFPKMPCAFHFVCFGSRCSRPQRLYSHFSIPFPMENQWVCLTHPHVSNDIHELNFQDVHRICVGVTPDNMWQHQVTETYYRRLQKRDSGWDFVIDGGVLLAASSRIQWFQRTILQTAQSVAEWCHDTIACKGALTGESVKSSWGQSQPW